MSFAHKAYAFDWDAFEKRVRPALEMALSSHNPEALLELIERNAPLVVDPYEGEPLSENWADDLERGDEHEIGDYALTLCYRPTEDFGLGESWSEVEALLSDEARRALLGQAFGPEHNLFDPGRMGSYFQSPGQCRISLHILELESHSVLRKYVGHLRRVCEMSKGLYVTF